MAEFFSSLWYLTLEMAPYLLLGFSIAGLLYGFVPTAAYHRYLSRPGWRSVFNATLLGIPLPLCSCGVLPTTVSLRRSGASRGACTSFLIATPQTGVDSILATYSLLGLPFAIIRPIAALVTGVLGGWGTNQAFKHELVDAQQVNNASSNEDHEHLSFVQKLKKSVLYAFGELLEDVGRWLVLGLLIAAAITVAVPDDFFSFLQQYPLLNMFLVLAVAIPMYVCATGSIPIALSLMFKGMTPGAAFVLLMAGPAINAASMLVIDKTFGRKQTVVYLASIVCGALCFGLLIDYLLPAQWFVPQALHAVDACNQCTASGPSWWQSLCGVTFALLLLRGLWGRFFSRKPCACHNEDASCNCDASCSCAPGEEQAATASSRCLVIKVNGMRCSHCVANVKECLSGIPSVAQVDVDLPSGEVTIQARDGMHLDLTAITREIESVGYKVEKN